MCVKVWLLEPESLRQVLQKQVVVALGGEALVYVRRAQAHEPRKWVLGLDILSDLGEG